MEIAYLHLVTNHIPIIGVPFALALLLIGIWRGSNELKAVSFLVFSVLGVLTLGVYLLGQGGEDFVEHLPGVSEQAIEDHEDFAKFALASVAVLAILAAFALVRYGGLRYLKPRIRTTTSGEGDTSASSIFPKWIVGLILLIAVACSGILGFTGRLGGKIRHPEFHGGTAPTDNERDEGDKERGRDRRGRDDR
jgi:hypothetical protein